MSEKLGYPIDTAPRDGRTVRVRIPYTHPEWTNGYWCPENKCFRFDGDDGPEPEFQPTHWMPGDMWDLAAKGRT